MVRTRSQLENLSKDELIDEVLTLETFKNNINVKFSKLNDCFNNFEAKYKMVNSNLSNTRYCNDLLELITQLERNKLSKSIQYHLIVLMTYWNNLCAKALSLTGISVEPDDLQACHRMRKKARIIIKFKCRKQKHHVLLNCKTLQNKSLDLTQLKFSGKLFVNESMCHENHQLAYKCCQLKSVHKIHSTWLYHSTLDINLWKMGLFTRYFILQMLRKFWGLIILMNI